MQRELRPHTSAPSIDAPYGALNTLAAGVLDANTSLCLRSTTRHPPPSTVGTPVAAVCRSDGVPNGRDSDGGGEAGAPLLLIRFK